MEGHKWKSVKSILCIWRNIKVWAPLKAVNRHYVPLYIYIYGYGNIEKNKEGFTFWGKDKLDNYTYIYGTVS